MPSDPQSRRPDDGTKRGLGEEPSALEEVAQPSREQDAADTEWLSMATADPALFIKGSE